MRHTANHQSGFTLIELAIVLTILGLLTTGILAGRTMVRQAQLRGVMSEIERYKTASLTFLNQFNSIPGDMQTAFTYWGRDCVNSGDAVTDAQRCNGNGNRVFDPDTTGTPLGTESESFRYWQHLVLAELIPGPFTGQGNGTSGLQGDIGINVPASSLGSGNNVYTVETLNYAAGGTDPHIVLGAAATDALPKTSTLTPRELSSLDEKVDDSMPNTGTLGGENGTNTIAEGFICINGSAATDAYNLTERNATCTAWFRMLP